MSLLAILGVIQPWELPVIFPKINSHKMWHKNLCSSLSIGLYDLFNYRDEDDNIQQHNPVLIENQNPNLYEDTYDPDLNDLIFTLPKAKKPCPEKPNDRKSIQEDVIWQITVEVHKKETKSIIKQ